MFFDGNEVEDMSFAPLPKGVYPATIIKQDYRTNKAGNGMLLELEFQILEKSQKKVRNFYNLQHPNPTAQGLGKSEFKKVLGALGMKQLSSQNDLNLLIGKKVAVKLGHNEYDGSTYNCIDDVMAMTPDVEAKIPSNISAPQQANTDQIPF